MLTFVAAIALAPATYQIKPTTDLSYDFKMIFDGFLPILGGNEGTADIDMVVKVKGELGGENGNMSASTEITKFEMAFNGGKLPLTLDMVTDVFPKSSITFTPRGEIVKNTAPDKKPPVRLPGLDVKRFPDITFLPIIFSEKELKAGEEWQFKKSFDGADMTYTCSFGEPSGDTLPVKIAIKQDYTVLENDSMEVVPKEDAVREVTTHMTGTGEANFDTKRGIFTYVKMKNVAKSEATDFDSKEKTERVLKQELTLKLKEEPKVAKPQPQKPVTLMDHASALWDSTVQFSQNLWDKTKGYAALAKLLIQSQMKMIPGFGGMIGR
ncbi:MAG: hypothetical protein R2688_00220 [Fimbriimonadaceae bacterium]